MRQVRRFGAISTCAVFLALLSGCSMSGTAASSTFSQSETAPSVGAETTTVEPDDKAELTVASVTIPSTLSAEEAGEEFVKYGFTDRYMAAATQEVYDKYYAAGGDIAPIEEAAKENSKIYDEALLAPGWETNDNLVNYSNNTAKAEVSYVET